LEPLNDLVVAAGKEERKTYIRIHGDRTRVELVRHFQLCDGLIEPAEFREVDAIPEVSFGITGLQIQGAAESLLGGWAIEIVHRFD
jgi:hypothetical protein